jgi:hypothetical protein
MRDNSLTEDGGSRESPAPPTAATPQSALDSVADDALFEHNIQQINLMRVAAGSMVKGLIMELERAGRDTYIRLRDPVPNGHAVSYDFVRGDRSLVGRIGRSLGFAKVTEDRLEVRHG